MLDEFGGVSFHDAAGHRLHAPVTPQQWWNERGQLVLQEEIEAKAKREQAFKAAMAMAPPEPSLLDRWRTERQKYILGDDDALAEMETYVRSEYAAAYDDQAAADLAADKAKDLPAPVPEPVTKTDGWKGTHVNWRAFTILTSFDTALWCVLAVTGAVPVAVAALAGVGVWFLGMALGVLHD